MRTTKSLVVQGVIEQKIFIIRRQKVMLDKDLALLYQVKPIALIDLSFSNIKFLTPRGDKVQKFNVIISREKVNKAAG